jgi:4-aminobutyrate aminotransferase
MDKALTEISNRILNREKLFIAPTLARYTSIVADRGEGSFIIDVEGRRYLDFASGIATNNVGHCHPRVVQAAIEQTKKMIHGSASVVHYASHVQLAEKLVEITPDGIDMVFFSNSGAEAVEGALKLARYTSGRQIIISFVGGFHGRTLGALSLTSSKAHYRAGYQALMPGFHHAPYPNPYRCPLGASCDSCSTECLSYLDYMLNTYAPASDVAALLVEPILGEGGYIVPPTDFLIGLRKLCDEHGILLIFDEVQTGFGRTGNWFAAQHFAVRPDIIVMAKGIASGFPLSAIGASRKLMEAWPAGTHGTTFGGNPVSVAAALASIAVIEEEQLLANARKRGALIIDRLRDFQKTHPMVGDVRGIGLMIGVEFVKADGTPDKEMTEQVRLRCLEEGLIVLSCGTWENVIRLIPPLNVSEAEVEEALGTLEKALA